MQLNVLVLICLICWSIWGIFDKKALSAARHLDVLLLQHIVYLVEIPVGYAIIMTLFHQCEINPEVWFWTGLGSMISSTSMLLYLIAMSRAEASYVLGITASYPIFVQIFACLFMHEPIVTERLLGSLLVVAGITLIGSSKSHDSPEMEAKSKAEKRRHKIEVLLFCAAATLSWGMTGLFDKKAVMLASPFKVYFARCVWDALILLIMFIIYRAIKHKTLFNNVRAWKYSIFSAACLSVGTISYLFAMTMASVSYVIVITGCYPLLMYVFAVIFLKERLSKLRIAGVLCVIIGGLLVQQTKTQ